MKDFRKLKVWEKAHIMTMSIYEITKSFPREELYGLTSQIRRAAVSVPTNIAEGCGRGTDGDFARFLQIAMGSATELEYLLFLSKDLTLLGTNDYMEVNSQIIEIKKMLTALIKSVNKSQVIHH